MTVPAGWYPDPMGLPQLRWWNNHAWTELTTEARPPLVMQQPTRLAYADDELPTRRQQREQRERDEQYAHLATDADDARDAVAAQAPLTVTLKELEPPAPLAVEAEQTEVRQAAAEPNPASPPTLEADIVDERLDDMDTRFTPRAAASAVSSPSTQSTQSSTQSARQVFDRDPIDEERQRTRAAEPAARVTTVEKLPIYTAPIWIIALVPMLQLVVSLLLLLGFGSSVGIGITATIWGGPYLLILILAIIDYLLLKRAGHERPASWAWALLTAPVYLIVRSMSVSRVAGFGLAPLLVWAGLGLLQLGSVLVVPGLLISALPGAFSMEAEQQVAAEASIIGANLAVTCPTTPPVLVGQTFSCSATSTKGDSYDVTVSLQRVNGWIDWKVDDWGIYTLSR
ncbi:DUF2510 domain-containing protein [Lacisediminihabitans profunda]|uniref:DUF2510 domain-containing protein n=1 Tax=Lacisediminihabitans profunda TaxID=2594790 RepID=UPI001C9CFCBC|nr:DUF2510 domain-containing protein [Lacisediminihabitans profunda]